MRPSLNNKKLLFHTKCDKFIHFFYGFLFSSVICCEICFVSYLLVCSVSSIYPYLQDFSKAIIFLKIFMAKLLTVTKFFGPYYLQYCTSNHHAAGGRRRGYKSRVIV